MAKEYPPPSLDHIDCEAQKELSEEEEDEQVPPNLWDAWNETAMQLALSHSAPMPSLSHLTYRDFEKVYEPSDDTFLFLDAIQHELLAKQTQLRNDESNGPAICLEIGCGTGVLSAFLRSLWYENQLNGSKKQPLLSFVTDINPVALQVTRRTFQQLPTLDEQFVECIQCDLASPLLPQLQGKVSFLLFNPPYVPTPPEEVSMASAENWLPAAWAGGTDGRQVLDRALPQMAALLSSDPGAAYIVTVDENRPRSLAALLQRDYGLHMRPLLRRRARNEFLTIQKITRIHDAARPA
jgi:release factor glutamine methyltransferase